MSTTPRHLTLREVIDRLLAEDARKVLRVGFCNPHSYRGSYNELAFQVAERVPVADMLRDANAALHATFEGWKGGDYEMTDDTDCHLVAQEGECGETLGAVLLDLMLSCTFDPCPSRIHTAAVFYQCDQEVGHEPPHTQTVDVGWERPVSVAWTWEAS